MRTVFEPLLFAFAGFQSLPVCFSIFLELLGLGLYITKISPFISSPLYAVQQQSNPVAYFSQLGHT